MKKTVILISMLLCISTVSHAQDSFYETERIIDIDDDFKLKVEKRFGSTFLTDPNDPEREVPKHHVGDGFYLDRYKINGNDVLLGSVYETFTTEEINQFASNYDNLTITAFWDKKGNIVKMYFSFHRNRKRFESIEPDKYAKLYRLLKERIKMTMTGDPEERDYGYISINFMKVRDGELLLYPELYEFE